MTIRKDAPLHIEVREKAAFVESSLPAETHRYVNLPKLYNLETISQDGIINVIFRVEGSLHTIGYCFFIINRGK